MMDLSPAPREDKCNSDTDSDCQELAPKCDSEFSSSKKRKFQDFNDNSDCALVSWTSIPRGLSGAVKVMNLDPLEDKNNNVIDLTATDSQHSTAVASRRLEARKKVSPGNLEPELALLPSGFSVTSPHGEQLQTGNSIEIASAHGDAESFLFITAILKSRRTSGQPGTFTIRGYQLIRCSDFNGVVPRKMNELAWHEEVTLNQGQDEGYQPRFEIPLESAGPKREVRFTNAEYPKYSFRGVDCLDSTSSSIRKSGILTVRWKITIYYETALHKRNNMNLEKAILRLRESDLKEFGQPQYVIKDETLRYDFRGETTLGGAYIPGKLRPVIRRDQIDHRRGSDILSQRNEIVDLTTPIAKSNPPPLRPKLILARGQRYSFGDAFCGGGGTSRGAQMAGLGLVWGFDMDQNAAATWKLNFEPAEMLEMKAHEVCEGANSGRLDLSADILHLSPPCQPFSPAHTVAGKNDEANEAAMFAVDQVLKITRPRIVTLEETFGIELGNSQNFFRSLIHQFTNLGFSVRHKKVQLATWGLPARRTRTIMIASCPGEALPDFPSVSHNSSSLPLKAGMKNFVTVRETLDKIPKNAPLREIGGAQFASRKPSWEQDSILPRCITTSGGQNYHPSGLRELNLAEYAALQGFPPTHKFADPKITATKRIIGNAVPPVVADRLLTHIRQWLEKEDRVEREAIIID